MVEVMAALFVGLPFLLIGVVVTVKLFDIDLSDIPAAIKGFFCGLFGKRYSERELVAAYVEFRREKRNAHGRAGGWLTEEEWNKRYLRSAVSDFTGSPIAKQEAVRYLRSQKLMDDVVKNDRVELQRRIAELEKELEVGQ